MYYQTTRGALDLKFADRLCNLREAHNLSMDQLADILGRSKSSINEYEKGRSLPSVNILLKIATYFGVTTDYLIGICDDHKISALPKQHVTKYIEIPPSDYVAIKDRLAFLECEYKKFQGLLVSYENDNKRKKDVLNNISKIQRCTSFNGLIRSLKAALEGIVAEFLLVRCGREERKGMSQLVVLLRNSVAELEEILGNK